MESQPILLSHSKVYTICVRLGPASHVGGVTSNLKMACHFLCMHCTTLHSQIWESGIKVKIGCDQGNLSHRCYTFSSCFCFYKYLFALVWPPDYKFIFVPCHFWEDGHQLCHFCSMPPSPYRSITSHLLIC